MFKSSGGDDKVEKWLKKKSNFRVNKAIQIIEKSKPELVLGTDK